MNVPAVYLGTQPGFNQVPPVELYNLLVKVGHHPVGSTVSRQTLEEHGYRPSHFQPSRPNQQKGKIRS
jgi:hypothetical protein